MNATAEKTNAPNLAGSEALSETAEAISPLHTQNSAAANDSQDVELTSPLGAIHVMRDWQVHTVAATAEGLANWCRSNPAPDIKPAGDSNAPNLGFLLTVGEDYSGIGHPKLGDVAFTHGCSFDLDKAAGFDIAATLERTEKAGLAAVFWESHNSTEAEPKGRLLVILDPPCPADKHAAVYEQLRAELCPLAPKGQHNANRGWNPPRLGTEVSENEGRPVDWRDVLARAPRQQKPEPRSPSAVPQAPAAIGPSHMEFAISMCQKHPPGTEDGRAGANLVSLGCKLILGCGLDIETAVVTALRHYDPRCTNAAGEPYPWGEDEIRRAFTKAAGKEPSKDQAQWRSVLDEAEAIAPDAGSPDGEQPGKRLRTVSAAELSKPLPRVPWLVKGLGIAPGRPTLVVGRAGSGKTLAIQELALAVASGQPVFGDARFSVRQGPVLHIDLDQGRYATARRYQQIAKGRGLDLATLPLELVFFGFKLTAGEAIDPESVQALANASEGKALVIIDSLRGLAPGLDENSSEFGEVLQMLTNIADLIEQQTNRPAPVFLVLHHSGKGESTAAGRGTSAIQDRAGAVWVVARDEGSDAATWKHEKASELAIGKVDDFTTALVKGATDDEGSPADVRIRTVMDQPKSDAVTKEERLAVARALVRPEYRGRGCSRNALEGLGLGIGRNRLRIVLDVMVANREVELTGSGPSSAYVIDTNGQALVTTEEGPFRGK